MMTRKATKASRRNRRSVPFTVRLDGEQVAVTGDFTGWTEDGIRLTRGNDGEWSTTLQLEPGEYEYRLRVDGRWTDDPGASRSVTNPYGGSNGILVVE